MSTKRKNVLADRYEVRKQLGAGGMGVVYLAHDGNLDTEVVIKMPLQTALAQPGFAERFMLEIKALVKMAHPHVVKILDVGTHRNTPFAVMQYLSGGSLESQGTPAKPPTLATWLPSMGEALDFVHEQGFLHRDVKPANILFDAHGNAYLSDFGIAKVISEGLPEKPSAGLTGTGMIIGTAEYMAPELIMGKKSDGRADQYSLAATVYEILSGKVPFTGPNAAAILVKQSAGKLPGLRSVAPWVSEELASAVERGLSKNPRDRYTCCAEFADAVLGASQDCSPSAEPRRSAASIQRNTDRGKIPRTRPETAREPAVPGQPAARTIPETQVEQIPSLEPPAILPPGMLVPRLKPDPIVPGPIPEESSRKTDTRMPWMVLLVLGMGLVTMLGGGLIYWVRSSEGGSGGSKVSSKTAKQGYGFEQQGLSTVRVGEALRKPIRLTRTTEQGAVELTCAGLPAGVKARPCTVLANQTEAILILDADSSAATGTFSVRVRGLSENEEEQDLTFTLRVQGLPVVNLALADPLVKPPLSVLPGEPAKVRIALTRQDCADQVVLVRASALDAPSGLETRLSTHRLAPADRTFELEIILPGSLPVRDRGKTFEIKVVAETANRQTRTTLSLSVQIKSH